MTSPRARRVAYVVHWQGGADTGPFHKITTHRRIWTTLGLDVQLFVTTSAATAADWERAVPGAVVLAADRARDKVRVRARVVDAVLEHQPDLAYIRHGLWYPSFDRLARHVPVVVEVGANDRAEINTKSAVKSTLHRVTRSRYLRACSGFVFVTHELAASPAFTAFDKPHVVVSNGIDLSDYDGLPATVDAPPRLVFLGHPDSPWHGVHELPGLARAFPDWQIDVVGPRPGEIGAAPDNLHLHHAMDRAACRPILTRADVGIGTLGLYRLGTEEASPLKTREYLAHGLPVIAGYLDTDFPETVPFLLRVPNRPGGLGAAYDEVARFVARWHRHRVDRSAVSAVDIGAKEADRVRFLRTLMG
jgi:glycosyltransferase involved in cell wall biosynthesis